MVALNQRIRPPDVRRYHLDFLFFFFLISISAFREIVDVGAASIRPVGGGRGAKEGRSGGK